MTATIAINPGFTAVGYISKARQMQENMRLAYKRHQDEILAEKDHIEFMENCLNFLNTHRMMLREKLYNPERRGVSKAATLSMSLEDKNPISSEKTSNTRQNYSLTDRISVSGTGLKQIQQSPPNQRFLSPGGTERWKKLKDFSGEPRQSIKYGINSSGCTSEEVGMVSPIQNESPNRKTAKDISGIKSAVRMLRSDTNPKYASNTISSKAKPDLKTQKTNATEAQNIGHETFDLRDSPSRNTSSKQIVNENKNVESRQRESTPSIQINFISGKVYSRVKQPIPTYLGEKDTSTFSKTSQKRQRLAKELKIDISNDEASNSVVNKLTNIYGPVRQKIEMPRDLISPTIQKSSIRLIQKQPSLSGTGNRASNRSMMTPKIDADTPEKFKKKKSLAFTSLCGNSYIKKQ